MLFAMAVLGNFIVDQQPDRTFFDSLGVASLNSLISRSLSEANDINK